MRSMENARIDPERQEKARQYARLSRRLILVDLTLGGVYLLAWLALGWSQALRDLLLGWTTNPWLLTPAFGLVFGAVYAVLSLPLSYYEGFILPHRYGMSTQTRKDWVIDQLKGAALGAVLGLLLLEVIYAILRTYPQTWWLWAAGFMLLFNVLLANLAPVLLFPIFYKFTPLADEYQDLAQRLMRLAKQAGASVKGVFQFDMSRRSTAANAALVGLGNTRRIILGDTLLKEFSSDEIETVLAHELGHHVNHDIPLGILIQSLLTLAGFYLASLALDWGVSSLGFSGPADVAAMPLLALVAALFGLVTMPIGNAYSRWRETQADAYALRATGKPAAFASAMTRLANQNLAEIEPEPWVEFLLYSHPALSKRIRMAQQYH